MNSVIANRYHLLNALAERDGNACLWVALDSTLQGRSALVVVELVPADKVLLGQVAQGVQNAAHLGDPSFSQVLGLERSGQEYYIIRELICGEPFADLLTGLQQTRSRLPLAATLALVADAARSLGRAHRAPQPMVHDGINPSTLFVGLDGVVRLLDLGVAGPRNQHRHRRGETSLEELRYLSPEQCLGGWKQPQSDVFSLGVVLWELVCGRPLFPQATDFDLMEAICDEPIAPPSNHNPEVPPFLDSLVKKALGRPKEQRFADAAQLAASLDRLLSSLNGGQRPNLSAILQQQFPNRFVRWNSLVQIAGPAQLEDTKRLVESLFPSSYSDRDDPTLVQMVEERTRPVQRAAMADDVAATAPMDAFHRERLKEDAAPADTQDVTLDTSEPTLVRGKSAVAAPAPRAELVTTDEFIGELFDGFDEEDLFAGLDAAATQFDEGIVTQEVTMERSAPAPVQPAPVQPAPVQPMPVQPAPAQKAAKAEPSQQEVFASADEPFEELGALPPLVDEDLDLSSLQSSEIPAAVEPAIEPDTEPPTARSAPVAEEPEKAAPSPAFVPQRRPAADDDEDDDDFVLPLALHEIIESRESARVLREDQRAAQPVAEVVLSAQNRALESFVLRGLLHRRFSASGAAFTLTLKGKKAVLQTAGTATGYIHRGRTGEREEIGASAKEIVFDVGDRAAIEVNDGLVYFIRFFYPPNPPARQTRTETTRLLLSGLASLVVAGLLHVAVVFGFITLSTSLGISLVVEDQPPVEVFAEGELAELTEPDPPEPEPPVERPRPPEPEPRPVDPAEQQVQIPQAVREQLDQQLRRPTDQPREPTTADDLLSSLTVGPEETVSDAVSNIDAIANTRSNAAHRVGGRLDALDGDGPQVATGGSRIDIDSGNRQAGRLEQREASREVRGTVSNVRALTRVQGSLARAEIERIVNRHRGAITQCYERALNDNPTLSGQITFEWTIAADGSVTNAREQTSTLGSPTVSNCILRIIRNMKFPNPEGGGSVEVAYPFAFQASM